LETLIQRAYSKVSGFPFFILLGETMSTRMEGITQQSLFSGKTETMEVLVTQNNRYRVLAEHLPWKELGDVANAWRAKQVNIHNGRPLNLRLHLGALIAQGMNRWTDRETEEMVAHHAGVRVLCSLEYSRETIDHTSIEVFRNQLTEKGVEAINQKVIKAAVAAGFTGSRLCSSDTTVQESPIAYPTEVGHMRMIAKKLVGMGSQIKKKLSGRLGKLAEEVQKTFTAIRLFTRGKGEAVVAKKKKLSRDLHRTVSRMKRLVEGGVNSLQEKARGSYRESLDFYGVMLSQIRYWMKTGFHRSGKIVSVWEKQARAITRNKAAKAVEFGRRWIITRMEKGYVIGTPCKKLGSDSDTGILPEVLAHFERIVGALPKMVVYDRGGDGPVNHCELGQKKIRNAIFRKGDESLIGLGRNTVLKARRERALSEAAIATIKHPRYGFNKPRARSSEGCIVKGHVAILGANVTRLARDWGGAAAAVT